MISHGSADMRFDKTIFYFLFLLAGCQGGSAEKPARQDNVYLTLIAGDKIYYYENKLNSKEQIDSVAVTEKDLLDVIEKAKSRATIQLYIIVKLFDEANSARNFVVVTDILKKKNIQYRDDPVISKKETEYLGFQTIPVFSGQKPEQTRLFIKRGHVTEKEAKTAHTILLRGTDDLYVYQRPNIKNGRKISAKKIDQYLSEMRKKDSNVVVIIKASSKASQRNVVDMLDQMTINNIKNYLLEDSTEEEERFLILFKKINIWLQMQIITNGYIED